MLLLDHDLGRRRRLLADLPREISGEVLADHPPHPLLDTRVEVGVAQPLPHGIEAFLGLDHRVQEAVRPIASCPGLLALEHVEQRGDDESAARRQWHADDAVTAVGRLDRLPLANLDARQVVRREHSAARGKCVDDALRDPPLVERVGTALSDGVQGAREIRLDELVPGLLRLIFAVVSPAQEDPRRLRIGGEALQTPLGSAHELDVHLEPAERDLLGGADDLRERFLSEALEQLGVSLHRCGNGDAERTGVGKVLPRLSVLHVHVRPRSARAHFAEVEHVHLSRPRRVDQRESAPAESRALRLDDAEREGRGDGRVRRVAAAAQHGCARLGGKRVGRGDGAAGRYRGKREQQREQEHGGAL